MFSQSKDISFSSIQSVIVEFGPGSIQFISKIFHLIGFFGLLEQKLIEYVTSWCKWVLQQCNPFISYPEKYLSTLNVEFIWTFELKLREKLLNLIKDNLIYLMRYENLRFKCKWWKYKVTQLSSDIGIQGAHITELSTIHFCALSCNARKIDSFSLEYTH